MDGNDGSVKLSIDSEEFTRLQTQLIELRTTNYQLKEEKAKAQKDLNHLQETHHATLKELEKANKTIQKSKKAKEYQLLADENESLVLRLHTQEEDFKLQNKTLLDEIANVCESNDELKKRLKTLESGPGSDGTTGGHTPEIVRLKAENAALQKSLQANRDRLNSESGGDAVDSSSAVLDSPEVDTLRLSLATLEEERNLLREQISSLTGKEESYVTEIEQMKKEMEKQSEKLRKKQESLVQLQKEKENLITEHKKSYDQVVASKDLIIKDLRHQIASYEQQSGQIVEATKLSTELNNELGVIRAEKHSLQSKLTDQSKTLTVITQERDDAKHLLDELSIELQSAKRLLEEERTLTKRYERDITESRQASDDLADQLLSIKEDQLKSDEELKSLAKLAESRKSLLDNMAIKEQQVASEQKKKEDELVFSYKSQIDDLKYKLELEKATSRELQITVSEATDMKEKLAKYENIRVTHEEAMKQLKENAEREKTELQDDLERQKDSYEKEIKNIKEELSSHEIEKQELKEKLESAEDTMNEKLSSVKIVEKKSNALIKDLKRQLQQLQKKEEKLQHQLLESRGTDMSLISVSSSQEDPQLARSHSRESSISSIRGGVDMSTTSTPNTSFQQPFPDVLPEDTQALMDKIAMMQHEKWLLEEKVQHLENTGSALAEDVLQKSTIIQKYYMENKADHTHSSGHLATSTQQSSKMSPMRLVPWSKLGGGGSAKDETMAEVNRKMQRALEEALMKNIHLQKDVDMLSAELQKQKSDSTRDSTPS